MKRVCFIGASTVEGMGDETGLGWPGRLAALEREAGNNLVAYNLGVRGQTLREIGVRAVAECSARIQDRKTDLIVLGTGMNDLARIGTGAFRTPQRRTLEDFTSLVEGLADLAPLLVVGPFPVCEAKMPFLSTVSGMKFDFRNSDIDEATWSYTKICSERGVPYLDLFRTLVNEPDYMDGLEANDGLHSNGEGYQVIAKGISKWEAWQWERHPSRSSQSAY
ncbi:GDSL-type esterase/lipase family protein [Pelagibius sp. Alg239-R121]|uniref:GDSL-type esterase/lipase family protein n=1 Tax=Pelagibius sp. Alg239-R121 TaxID=2993448 RepID=UPI0024A7635F|nr:GDSL-type esterase/lipase family protein [Pelagibius sp. Alg239-R121]